MIVKSAIADLGHGNNAVITDAGHFALELDGATTYMTADQAKDMWAKLGVLIREFNKWNG